MARARSAQPANPDQLTLDDWAEVLKASPRAPDTQRRQAATSDLAPAGSAEAGVERRSRCAGAAVGRTVRHRAGATQLLESQDALLTRTHLRELGLERRAVDAVFRALAVVALPGYSRPMIRVRDYLELLEHCTFRDDRVRPMVRAS